MSASVVVGFRSNLLGTHFTLFDNGDNPRKNAQGARHELVAVAYVSSPDAFVDDNNSFVLC